MLKIPQSVYDQLRRRGEAAYPQECCGILLGKFSGVVKLVERTVAVDNSSASPHNHYEISAKSLICTMREARIAGLEILGFYHSHPEYPAKASATDLAEAHWIGCSYVITEVRNGMAGATNSFVLAGVREEDKHFEAEEIILIPQPPPVQ